MIVKDQDGWYVRLRLGPRLWVVLGRWGIGSTAWSRTGQRDYRGD